MKKREALLAALPSSCDILIIGGGATGLGIALNAVSKGYKTILLEQSDFAKGTSSRSTKLVHGGVRYLAKGALKLVKEANFERGLLIRNAPHLVKNQTFIIPLYNTFDKWKYLIGLTLYDWIAGRLSLGPSLFVSRKEMLKELPGVATKGLIGGIKYHDGQFDDSRLAINLMQTILEKGGHVMNYMQVSSFTKNESGKIVGVTATDTETGMNYPFFSKVVVNATGVFTDAILQMDQPGCRKTIRASQGVHLVLERRFYTAEHALMIPKTSDGRVLFAVPWHNKVVVGTTDTPIEDINLEPTALKSEIDFILETSAAYLTNKPQRKDVLSVFAGLRPLAAPQSNKQKTKEISRSHKIIVSPSGLYTILGGKWTTFRKMGEDMINRIELQLNWPRRNGSTKELPIHGATENINLNDVLYYYGSDAVLLKQEMQDSGMKWLSTSLSIHEMQVRWAVRKEMARTVDDFLSRRCRALLLDAEESVRMAPIVARIMAEELGKDERWEKAQVAAFEKLALSYQLKEA